MDMLLARVISDSKETLGRLIVFGKNIRIIFDCATLEPPWLDNKKNISCIPVGLYRVKHRYSEKYEHHLVLIDVNGREYILIHWGNYYSDTEGCIIVGTHHKDINKDGKLDVVNSRRTFNNLMVLVKDETDMSLRICYTCRERGQI